MKEFTTAAERAAETDEDEVAFEFTIDGQLCRAFRPNDGQLAVLVATTGRHSSGAEQVAGVVNFFVSVLDEASHSYVVSRLLDRRHPLPVQGDPDEGTVGLQDIMEWLIEQWSGRPTESRSDSASSPPSTGSRSTAVARA